MNIGPNHFLYPFVKALEQLTDRGIPSGVANNNNDNDDDNFTVPLATRLTAGANNNSAAATDAPPAGGNSNRSARQEKIEELLRLKADELSVAELKDVLAKHFVTFEGVLEKNELVDKLKKLQRETDENRTRVLLGLPEDAVCKICMDAPVDCVLLDCGHMLACTACGHLLQLCPICREPVARVVHTFRS